MSRVKGSVCLTAVELGKAKVLRGMGHSFRAIAKQLGKSDHTIKKALAAPEIVAEVEIIKKDLGTVFEELAHRMIESITDQDITKLNAYQRTVSGAIATDKAQLLKGEPTMNVGLLLEVASIIRGDRDDKPQLEKGQPQHALPPPKPK